MYGESALLHHILLQKIIPVTVIMIVEIGEVIDQYVSLIFK